MNAKMLSIVLLSYYSGNRIERAYRKIREVLDAACIPFEFVVMDDGSKDDSYAQALSLEKREPNVRAYRLSRNCGSHYSIFAGLSVARGGCVMPMADDEQQPYATIVDMYRLWEEGHKVVIPYRLNRADSLFSRIFASAYYGLMTRFSSVPYPPGGADLFFIDREVVDILNTRIHPINTSSISEVLRLGFDPYFYGYERPLGLNGGKSRWSFRKKLRLAKDNFFSASTFPIQCITALGAGVFALSLTGIAFYLYIAIWGNHRFWGLNVPGWTSLILAISFFGGLVMLSLGVIAEYIWRIYEEVKARPGYVIQKKGNSDGIG